MLKYIATIVVLFWFYRSANKVGEKPLEWVVIGAIGFWLAAYITQYAIVEPVSKSMLHQKTPAGWITQVPAVIGLLAAYLIRGQFLLKRGKLPEPPPEQ